MGAQCSNVQAVLRRPWSLWRCYEELPVTQARLCRCSSPQCTSAMRGRKLAPCVCWPTGRAVMPSAGAWVAAAWVALALSGPESGLYTQRALGTPHLVGHCGFPWGHPHDLDGWWRARVVHQSERKHHSAAAWL